MSEIQSYEDLVAWRMGVDVSLQVYQVTSLFPDGERFGLVAQLRRASVSLPSNIAEGYGRGTRPDYLRFLRMTRGSLYEVETQLLIAQRLGYVKSDAFESLDAKVKELGRVLAGLIRSIERSADTPGA